MTRLPKIALLVAAALVTAGCESTPSHTGHSNTANLTRAVAVLIPTEGSSTTGIVTFIQTGGAVTVTAEVTGLSPNADHAWHIHEFGDLRDAKGKATGGHYNPEGHPHGLPAIADRHAGDLGNLQADANGNAYKTVTVHNCTIGAAYNPIIGRGVIVHAKMDDGGQPTGNAGARIAQGVIGVMQP